MVQGEVRVGRVGVVPFVNLDMTFLHLCIFDNSIFLRIEDRRFWGIEIEN